MNRPTMVFAAAILSAGFVFAQRPGGGGGTPPDPQTMIQRRVDMLATLLSLSDDQKTQATTIFTNALSATQALRPNLQSNRDSLNAAVKSNDTAAIDTLSQQAGALSGQITAINSKAEAAFYAVLTADQQTKYDSLPHGGPGGPRGFGPGRSGPPIR